VFLRLADTFSSVAFQATEWVTVDWKPAALYPSGGCQLIGSWSTRRVKIFHDGYADSFRP